MKHQSGLRSSSGRREHNIDVEGECDFGARLGYPRRGRREKQEKKESEYSPRKGGYDAQQARFTSEDALLKNRNPVRNSYERISITASRALGWVRTGIVSENEVVTWLELSP
jgi:hypothetical protein